MSRPLRILHLADSHIGAELPDRPRMHDWRRGDEIVASFRHALAPALRGEVDLVIHAGDVFDRADPGQAAILAAAAPLLEVAAAGVPVVIAPGNHERSLLPASLFFAHENLHIAREPTTFSFRLCDRRVAVAAIPFIRRRVAEAFADALRASQWTTAAAELNILATHQAFESATCGPGNYRFRAGEDVLPRDLPAAGFDYVAAGHVHRHQRLEPDTDGPPIVYAGSTDRITFAEKDEPKGAVFVEQANGRVAPRFVEHAVRPMVVLPLDISGLNRAQVRARVAESLAAAPRAAIAQLRLSGQATRDALRGVRLADVCRDARPDVSARISVQAIEFVTPREIRTDVAPAHPADGARAGPARPAFAARPPESTFESLSSRPLERFEFALADLKRLPNVCGVYALRDLAGRLLYVGKSKRLRARVRAHVGPGPTAAFFDGWTRQVAAVEAIETFSELEAQLIEAELIRRLRPPFNRQMRQWSRYCYLAPGGAPYGQLRVVRDAPQDGPCFGPYRTRFAAEEIHESAAVFFGLALCPPETRRRGPLLGEHAAFQLCQRYFSGLCAGPCGGRVSGADYSQRLAAREALLRGENDAALAAAEAKLAALSEAELDTPAARVWQRVAQCLRAAFDHGATLRQAEGLVGSALVSGPEATKRRVLVLSSRELQVEDVRPAESSAAHALRRWTLLLQMEGRTARRTALPKDAVDGLCLAARALARTPDACGLLSPADARLKPRAFLQRVFA